MLLSLFWWKEKAGSEWLGFMHTPLLFKTHTKHSLFPSELFFFPYLFLFLVSLFLRGRKVGWNEKNPLKFGGGFFMGSGEGTVHTGCGLKQRWSSVFPVNGEVGLHLWCWSCGLHAGYGDDDGWCQLILFCSFWVKKRQEKEGKILDSFCFLLCMFFWRFQGWKLQRFSSAFDFHFLVRVKTSSFFII